MNKEFKTMKLKDIVPYENNPRINEEAVAYVEESMKQCENIDPIEVDEDNVILSGHTRLIALKRLGYKDTEVLVVSGLTEEQKRKYRILANKTAEIAQWDFEKLEKELEGLDFDGFDFGFDFPEEEEKEPEIIEDLVPEETEPIAKNGDIWILGRHKLLCGDCTKEANLDKLMEGEAADLLLTDPPYNVNYEGGTGKKIENDNMESSKFQEFLYDAFRNACRVLKEGGAFYIWYASREVVNFSTALERAGLQVRQELIWNKNALVLGRQDYQWKHEPCLYGWKEGAAHYFINDRTLTTVQEEEIDPTKMKKEELVKLVLQILGKDVPTTVINEDRPSRSEEHPTMKPIKLIARQVRNSTKQDETVLDLFGGSGSTLIACEQLGRTCRTMELSEHYCDVIIQRYINLKESTKDVYRIRDGKKTAYDKVFK